MDMFTVLSQNGTIIARSRLWEVIVQYITDTTILVINGEVQ